MSDTNLYFVRWHGEEGQSSEHGIFTDPNVARDVAEGIKIDRYSSVVVTSFKREGAEFVRTEKGDPGHYDYVRELDCDGQLESIVETDLWAGGS